MKYSDLLPEMRSIGLSLPEERIPEITDEPKISGFFCYANETATKQYITEETLGQGYNPNPELARIKSLGEFLERLCLSNPLMKKISEKTFFQPGKNFVDPALFFSYFQEQVPNREEIIESTRKGSYRWYPVLDLFTGKEKLIPAQMIFLSENFDDEDSIRREQTSSGAAFGHKSSKLAIQNGLLELVERDAAISSYLMRREVPLINKFSGHIKDLLDYLKRYRLENYILDVTDDLNVPSVISVTLDRTGIGDALALDQKLVLVMILLFGELSWNLFNAETLAELIKELIGKPQLRHLPKTFIQWEIVSNIGQVLID